MGTALYDKGDLEGARKSYEDALKMARQVGAQRVVAAVTGNIGNIFYDQGKSADARRYYEQGLEIDRRIDDKRGVASDLVISRTCCKARRPTDLCKAQEESLQAFAMSATSAASHHALYVGSVLLDRGELQSSGRDMSSFDPDAADRLNGTERPC
jgi:tetratricopeptide (TPR) repeat protein